MSDKKIAVLGLGYVGLPLAVQLSLSYQVKGFDLDNNRVSQLRKGIDKTLEVNESLLRRQLNSSLSIYTDEGMLANVIFYGYCSNTNKQ